MNALPIDCPVVAPDWLSAVSQDGLWAIRFWPCRASRSRLTDIDAVVAEAEPRKRQRKAPVSVLRIAGPIAGCTDGSSAIARVEQRADLAAGRDSGRVPPTHGGVVGNSDEGATHPCARFPTDSKVCAATVTGATSRESATRADRRWRAFARHATRCFHCCSHGDTTFSHLDFMIVLGMRTDAAGIIRAAAPRRAPRGVVYANNHSGVSPPACPCRAGKTSDVDKACVAAALPGGGFFMWITPAYASASGPFLGSCVFEMYVVSGLAGPGSPPEGGHYVQMKVASSGLY